MATTPCHPFIVRLWSLNFNWCKTPNIYTFSTNNSTGNLITNGNVLETPTTVAFVIQ